MKKILLFGLLFGLVFSCAGQRGFDQYTGAKSDIRHVIQVGHSGVVQAVALSPDGRFAVSGSADGTLKFWDIATGREIYTSYHHLDRRPVTAIMGGSYGKIALIPQITCIDISAQGDLLLSGASDGNVVVTEIKTGAMERIYQQHSKSINAVAFSNGAKLAVTGDASGEIHLWQIPTGITFRKFRIRFRSSQITALDLSPDGQIILAGDSEGIIRLIEVAAEQSMRILGYHSSRISSVKFSADGRRAVSGSWDGSVKLWETSPPLRDANRP